MWMENQLGANTFAEFRSVNFIRLTRTEQQLMFGSDEDYIQRKKLLVARYFISL